jgi:hypothetical protein
MIVVRETFTAKYGRAGEAVAYFKQHQQEFQQLFHNMPARVLTDLSGRFDTVVLEQMVESIDRYFEITRAAFANPDAQKLLGPMGELFESGTREFYTLETETGT